jgi:hypothetical protein
MTEATMPRSAGATGGRRDITIANWQPRIKNTLRGFFSATLPSGLTIHHLALHEKNESRWIGLPSREWVNEQNVKQYARLIEFRDRGTADKFQATVLAALDRHLESLGEVPPR